MIDQPNPTRAAALEALFAALKANIEARDSKSWRLVLEWVRRVEEAGR